MAPTPDIIKKVFLVCADWPFASSIPVRAFLDSVRAEEFCAQCNTYQATRFNVLFPDGTDKNVSDVDVNIDSNEFEEFSSREQQWRSGHPAGDIGNAVDSFSVMPVVLDNG